MNRKDQWQCEKCGAKMQLFIVRPTFVHILLTMAGIALYFSLKTLAIQDTLLRVAATYLGVLAAFGPMFSLIRVRCLTCEPEAFKNKWG